MSDVASLRDEINIETAGSHAFEVEAFARVFAKHLEEAEHVFDLTVEALRCNGPRGRRLEVLGYAEDLTDGSLTLLAGRYFGDDSTLTLTDARDVLSRATDFISASVDEWLETNLEASAPEFGYAKHFRERINSGQVSRIRAVLITDGIMSNRIRTIESSEVAGLRCSYEVWDQRRVLEASVPELGSEDIIVDFTKWLPEGLPCLIADQIADGTHTYLAVLPGQLLVDVFREYGSLLLESNVRTFLSARGTVNKGIQSTLHEHPERFLAYNNGLTTTATEVAVEHRSTGTVLTSIRRWQIVNGGQTTASLAHFMRTNKDKSVEDVNVQMKLVTVGETDASAVVQAVAKYANSQNRVSASDLFSTHEFHIRIEQLSRRLRPPPREGAQYRSGWYYERARGQWENDRAARGGASEQKKFDLEYPKSQRITKTDWAKYAFCWGKHPDFVSKGAQSVFAAYAEEVDKQWERDDSLFNDDYFHTNVAKAILFEQLRSAVLKEEWYRASPGYLANIVAYTISRFALELDRSKAGKRFDFDRVWRNQRVDENVVHNLVDIAHAAQSHLTDPARPQANVTQWAKQQACWEKFKGVAVALDSTLDLSLISAEAAVSRSADARQTRKMDAGFEAIGRIVAVQGDVWHAVALGTSRVTISPMESDLLKRFAGGAAVPSERQATALLRLLTRMAENGVIASDAF